MTKRMKEIENLLTTRGHDLTMIEGTALFMEFVRLMFKQINKRVK